MLKPSRSTAEVSFLIVTFFIGLAIGVCSVSIFYKRHAFSHRGFHRQVSGTNNEGELSMLEKRDRQRWAKAAITRHWSPSAHSHYVKQASSQALPKRLWSPDRYRKEYNSLAKIVAKNKRKYSNQNRFGIGGLLGFFSFPVYENIAQKDSSAHPIATQSSNYDSAVASRANDGNTDGDYWHGSVAIANKIANPYWEVTFNKEYLIASIVVFNRKSSAERLAGMIVEVQDSSNRVVVSSTFPRTQNYYVWDNIFKKGKKVKVRLPKTEYLQLAEVQVWTIKAPSTPSSTPFPTPSGVPTPVPTTQSGQAVTPPPGQAGQTQPGQTPQRNRTKKAFISIKKKSSSTLMFIIIGGSVLLCCCICGCLAALAFFVYKKKAGEAESEASSESS